MTLQIDERGTVHRASVGHVDDLDEGQMKMATVGERRVVVIKTASGHHALDNACPHQGYGLVTGSLDGELLTCQWHNWKYRVTDGRCVIGEEDVPCHRVEVDDSGELTVEVVEPTQEQRRELLWPSLARAIERDYRGQIARDAVRLLDAGAAPAEIVARAVVNGAPRTEWGIGHEMAMAADCLVLAERWNDDDAVLAVVQALAGISETTRDRPPLDVPPPDAGVDLAAAVEAERVDDAMAATVAMIEAGAAAAEMRHRFIEAVSAHHIGYGHGAIYTQKAFELLERVGWRHAGDLLPHLAAVLTRVTREDTLPYMVKANRAIAAADLDALATAPRDDDWRPDDLAVAMLDADDPPIGLAVEEALGGAGIEGVLDAASLVVSHRLLRYDFDHVELDPDEPFGWLDITHGLTYANAARWAWRNDPGPQAARLALYVVWLAYDTGRSERRRGAAERATLEPGTGDLELAIRRREPDEAVAIALGTERGEVADALQRASLRDGAGSFIVAAHLVKSAVAAEQEAEALDSPLPLAAIARFCAAPRVERFVARAVHESIEFLATGRPPIR